MKKYIFRRILQLIPILVGLTFLTFLLLYLSPGDAAEKKLKAGGIAVSEETLEATRENMGLNRPFLVQYGNWAWDLLHGDLGISYKDEQPVARKLIKGLGYTAVLSLGSLLFALLLSIPLSVCTAVKKDRFLDLTVRFFSFVFNSLPNFLISVLLMYWFCIRVKLLPVIAEGSIKGLCLPCLALGLPMTGRFLRQFRAEIVKQLNQEYVMGARARGVKSAYILFRDVLHNSSMTILTIAGLSVGELFGGSVVIETVFRWPGIGKLVMDSITARDYPVIQGFVIFSACVYLLVNLLTDIGYRYIDPRVRTEEEG